MGTKWENTSHTTYLCGIKTQILEGIQGNEDVAHIDVDLISGITLLQLLWYGILKQNTSLFSSPGMVNDRLESIQGTIKHLESEPSIWKKQANDEEEM